MRQKFFAMSSSADTIWICVSPKSGKPISHATRPFFRLSAAVDENPAGFRRRPGDCGVVVSRFRYARDPVCVAACACYAANRWLVPFAWKGMFLRNYFDDTLLIPAALPLVLWLHQRFKWRPPEARPTWSEIIMHWAVWSVAAELVAPHFFARVTGDPWDVAAYAGGALVSGLIWQLA